MIKLITLTLVLYMIAPLLQAAEADLYDFLWLDPDKKVYVLQNKLHKKKNSFYLTAGYIQTLNQKFVSSHGLTVRGGYFIHEEWGFEIMYNKYSNSNNSTYKDVMRVNGSVPFVRKIDQSYAGLFIWSPFYGKINTFNKIYYFDWSFGIGPAQIDAQSNLLSVSDSSIPDAYKSESFTGAVIKTQTRFYITKRFHINLEYLNTNYKAKTPTSQGKTWRSQGDVLFMVGLSF